MNRGDLTKPDARGDEQTLSSSPSDESRRVEEPAPGIPEVIRERPSEREASRSEGQTRVVLLPVDPYLVHLYWRLAPPELENAYTLLGEYGEQAQPVLKFYDVTHIIFDGMNAHSSFEVDIELGAGNWYVHLWSPGRSYCVDLGFRTEGGRFLPLARSNVAETSPAWPSARVDEHYTLVDGDFRQLPVDTPRATAKPSALAGSETLCSPDKTSRQKERRLTEHGIDRLIDQARIWLRRLTTIYTFPVWARPRSKPDVLSRDLTEVSEKKFVSGLFSSHGPQSHEAKKDTTQRS